jgi:hypothetical protein
MITTTKHCKHGHFWTAANTRWQRAKNGKLYRACRRCHADQQRRAYLPRSRVVPLPKRVFPLYSNRDYPL